MSTVGIQIEKPQATDVDTASPATAKPVERVPLTEVLRQIRRDAATHPRRYAEQTSVPAGGE